MAPLTQTCEDLLDKPFHEAVSTLKLRLLITALRRAKYNQKKAAEILGLTYHQFRALYRKYSDKLV
jgi:psp operon transcriptional activator